MATLHIDLTDQENDSLLTIARQRGKSQDELLRDAIQDLISQCQQNDRRVLLQSARGIWKNRTDVPSPEELRREWDRL
ncbi:MAG: CopG family transcriptional regulator [Candidatus Latescibacteria bacterium]|jgi:hypothetical protein|nr:CopG family transcriptional regulator [Candidatus Latescibacterota bacterium]MBT5832484.1 CopG family transcriptional regulator [Candidatus Latescibacterota bacterium]